MKQRKQRRRRDVAERFWEKVAKRESHECWFWRGSLSTNGYGQFMWNYKPQRTHRMAYLLTFGEIPKGMLVCHRCDMKGCCNPAHLFLGTAKDNTQDMVSKGRAKGAQGEKHRSARLTADLVRQIRAAVGTNVEIAARFSISEPHVSNIRSGKKWAHIPLVSLNVH